MINHCTVETWILKDQSTLGEFQIWLIAGADISASWYPLPFILCYCSHKFRVCQRWFLEGSNVLCVSPGIVLVNISLRLLRRHTHFSQNQVKKITSLILFGAAIDASRAAQYGKHSSCLIAWLRALFPVRSSVTCLLEQTQRGSTSVVLCLLWYSGLLNLYEDSGVHKLAA